MLLSMGLSGVGLGLGQTESSATKSIAFLTPRVPIVSSRVMELSIRMGVMPKYSTSLRMAIAFGIALVMALTSSIQVEAANAFDPSDHAAYCDCGPKCRQDRCCCRPAEPEPPKANPDHFTESREAETTAAAKTICQMRSRCQDPVDSNSPSKLRPLCESSRIDRGGIGVDDRSSEWILTDTFFWASTFQNRIERPPRFSTFE
jgi:hypothetical protein